MDSARGLLLSSSVFSIKSRFTRLIIAGKSENQEETSLINVVAGQKFLKLRSHEPCPVSASRTLRLNYVYDDFEGK